LVGGNQALTRIAPPFYFFPPYDRVENPPGIITRWHQEDTCQALSLYPNRKYQADGGPSADGIVILLDQY
jgi:hypothetical protein